MARSRMQLKSHASQHIRDRLLRSRGDVDHLLNIAVNEQDRERVRHVYCAMMQDFNPGGWHSAMELLVYGHDVQEAAKKTGLPDWQIEHIKGNMAGALRKTVLKLLDEGKGTAKIAEILNQPRGTITGIVAHQTARLNKIRREESRQLGNYPSHICDGMTSKQLMNAYIVKPFGYQWKKATAAI